MASVKSVDFDDAGKPEAVTLRLSVEEAAFIATFVGDQSAQTAEVVMPNGGAVASSALYNTLSGQVFYAYWDAGVDGYLAGRTLHT
jgi:hypothetical protein